MADALAAVASTSPDVVTMDVRLPDGNGIDAVRTLRAAHPQLGIVVLTMYAEDEHLLGALEAGASAFVAKDAPADDVVAAARHAAAAPDAFSATDLAEAMRRRLTPPPRACRLARRRCCSCSLTDCRWPRSPRRCYISESTTKTHISKLYDKLGAANRAQALMTAMRRGLITAR